MLRATAFAFVLALGACAGTQRDFQRAFVPGQPKEGSKLLAYQAASFAQGFSDAHAMSWDARLAALDRDGAPMLAAVAKSDYRFEIDLVQRVSSYEVNGVLVPRSGAGERFVLPGAMGTDPAAYDRALAPAAATTHIPGETLKKGHFAVFAMATMSLELDASDESMRHYAFGLLCLREKLRRGEQADYMAPLRDSKESIEDVDLALRVVADHHAATSRWRGEVLATTAIVRAYESAAGPRALAEQIAESRAGAKEFRASHPRPTMEQFGVGVKEWKLPTPDAMLEVLDKDGYVTAAVLVAKGVATGSPGATIQGMGKLAPKSSSLRIAADGVAAAARGDLSATTDAVLALAEKQSDVAPIAERLHRVKAGLADVRSGAAAVRGAAAIPTSVQDAQKKLDRAQRGATQIQRGTDAATKP
ncbi:MAG TPA: hypothetical protein VIF62_23600 [Labilithrix sp.]